MVSMYSSRNKIRTATVVCVSFILFLSATLVQCMGRGSDSLFELSEHVVEINEESLAAIQDKTEQRWAINAYSPGCPHCRRFAPKCEQVGENLHGTPFRVGAINCVKYRTLCRSLKVDRYPTLLLVNWPGAPAGEPGIPASKQISKAGGVEDIVREIEKGLGEGDKNEVKLELPPEGEEQRVAPVEGGAPGVPAAPPADMSNYGTGCPLRIEDAVASIRWVLTHETMVQDTLEEDRWKALLDFFKLLGTTFPGPANRASFRNLEKEMRRNPGLKNSESWDKRMQTLEIGTEEVAGKAWSPDNSPNWPAANRETGSDPYTVKYTAGLWALFHALSVSEAPTRQQPHEVMDGIHSFVSNFFRCSECRRHFLEMYEAGENGRLSIPSKQAMAALRAGRGRPQPGGDAQLALWVWRMHNAVNVRVAEEDERDRVAQEERDSTNEAEAGERGDGSGEGETPNGSMSLWPRPRECPACWRGFPKADGQPEWHEDNVLKFLKATYSCPEKVGERFAGFETSWTAVCVLGVAFLVVVLWVRRWVESRGVGLSKKRADRLPSV